MSETPLPPATDTPNRVNVFLSMVTIGVVACLMATLFTAWIPTWYLPEAVAEPTYVIAEITQQAAAGSIFLPTATVEPRIGIVSGHWSKDPAYYDPGAVCPEALGNIKEVDVNHAIATRVQQILVAEGYPVDLLEEFDESLINYRALALVSIHSDSCEYINDEAKGFKVAAPLANPNPRNSQILVACIENRYTNITQMALHPGSVTLDMTQYHAFSEIDPDTPAAIIEVGFLNGDNERLRQDQDTLARGVAEGILCFLRGESAIQPSATPVP
ncbi:MAG: N-acetylmuramoyl-L-alanine amidase family protein [Chloroflexota bacterium]